jgi:mono/diheme cytochrome c family protein
MLRIPTASFALVLTAGWAAATAWAQTPASPSPGPGGAALFKMYCASCHGTTAKGDGPVAALLRHRPSDLTLLAKRNKGTFDAETVLRVIDGRQPVKGHGGWDMPVWGDAFQGPEGAADDKHVRARIEAIVDFLGSIQLK